MTTVRYIYWPLCGKYSDHWAVVGKIVVAVWRETSLYLDFSSKDRWKGKGTFQVQISSLLTNLNQKSAALASWLQLYRPPVLSSERNTFHTHTQNHTTPLFITTYIDLNTGTLFYLTIVISHFLSAHLNHKTSTCNKQRVCHKWRCVVCFCASPDRRTSQHDDNTSMETSLTSIPMSRVHIPVRPESQMQRDVRPSAVLHFLPQITYFMKPNSNFVTFFIFPILYLIFTTFISICHKTQKI